MGKAIIDLIGELVEISGKSTIDTIIFAIIVPAMMKQLNFAYSQRRLKMTLANIT